MSGKADAPYQRVRGHLARLGLDAAAECLAGELEAAQKEKPSYADFLEKLMGAEVAAVEAKSHERRLRLAGFPSKKRLEEFDFSAQPNLDRRLIEELATLRFVQERSNVLFVGQPGVGKTMLAIALGLEAVDAGHRVYYTTAAELVARTSKAAAEGRWAATMRFWAGPAVLIVDELGYLPMLGEAASHLFQVISRRYEKGATILTTNRGIASWGEIFEDTTVAAAVLDRLLHRATVVHIDGESYRMRAHHETLKGLRRESQGVGKLRDRKWGIFVILDNLKDQALAHFPSGQFNANAAWTVIACLAHNMVRWVGQLGLEGSTWRAARTIRRWLIALPGRLTRTARRWTLHLPARWPWQEAFAEALSKIRALPAAA